MQPSRAGREVGSKLSVAAAALAATVTCAIGFVAGKYSRRQSSGRSSAATAEGKTSKKEMPAELLAEQFSRNTQYFGEEGQSALSRSFVVVVGAGGVGSHAAVSLARAGVGKLRLIDFDRVTLSSLNRHAVALYKDVGKPKSDVIVASIKEFNGQCDAESRPTMFTMKAADQLLEGESDAARHHVHSTCKYGNSAC